MKLFRLAKHERGNGSHEALHHGKQVIEMVGQKGLFLWLAISGVHT